MVLDIRLSERQLRDSVRTSLVGRNLVYLECTGSTNSVAKVLADAGVPEGTVVVAAEQTAGKGRLGRKWIAPSGTCLLCSILFRPAPPLAAVHHLTMICALAAADAVRTVSGLAAELKWPNDLVVPTGTGDHPESGWRKLAGLLTEAGLAGDRLEYAVVGIGINVNVPPAILSSLARDATSLLAEVGHPVGIPVLFGALLDGIERRYQSLREGQAPHPEWAERLITLGKAVEARTAAGALSGIAEGVDDAGALLLRTSDGVLHRLMAGDVTLRPGGGQG